MNLLPTPAGVRLDLHMDVPMQVHGLRELGDLPAQQSEATLANLAVQGCHEAVLERLSRIISVADLREQTTLGDLSARLPFVGVVATMVTATELEGLVENLQS